MSNRKLAIKTGQLRASLFGGNFDDNCGRWIFIIVVPDLVSGAFGILCLVARTLKSIS